ncbi:MAG: sigma-70 family RNA polymerase sigma factor [Verrucomicrobiales bacterium]|nr:sigma-70 family RNA polymerase sigma factor [Verrucomicrobiales bacterium]
MPDTTPEDRYEQFVALYTRNEPGLRSFVRSLVPSWTDADEVMQNAGLVLWRKFSDFVPEKDARTEFFRWACVVARFEVLAWRRDKARDRHVFDEELIGLLADDSIEEEEVLAAERKALEVCLEKLSEKQRKIIMAAYEPGARLNRVAETLGKSATAFYKMLNRTRKGLLECIRSVTQEGEAA